MKIENLIAIDILLTHKKADDGLKSLQEAFGRFNGTVSNLSKEANPQFDATMDKLRGMGTQLSLVGDTMTKFVTVPIVGFLGSTVAAAAEYESAFAGVRKTVDATKEQLDKLSDSIKYMSTVMPASTNEIAGVAEAAGQLGIKVDDIEEFTKVMINLGVSTNLTSDKAAESLARLFNIMDLGADQYERAGSAVVHLGNNYATNEAQITNMTMRLAAAGKQAGMTAADVMGMATGLSAMGISAEAGGSSMSKFISNMNVAVSMGTGTMKELEEQTGMTWRQMQLMAANSPKEFRKLADSIGKPSDELKRFVKAGKDAQQMADVAGVSMEEFAAIFENNAAEAVGLFIEGLANAQDGIESMTLTGEDAVTILQEMGITEVRLRDGLLRSANAGDLLTGAIKDANKAWKDNTALTTEASIRYETFESQWEMMKNTFKLIAINMGEQLLPMMKDLVKWLQGIADSIANMDPKKFQALVKSLIAIAGVGPGMKLAGTAMKGLSGAGKLINVFKGETEALNKLNNQINDHYKGNGWTAKVVRAFQEMGYAVRENGSIMRESGKFVFLDPNKEAERLGTTVEKLTSSIGVKGLGGAFKSLASSPILKGGLWAIAIGYASTLVTEFDFLTNIAKGLWDVLKTGIDVVTKIGGAFVGLVSNVTDGAIGITDFIAVAGGIVLALNPATSAIGAFILVTAGIKALGGIFRGLKKDIEETAPAFELTEESIGKLTNKLDNVENSYTKFIETTSPKLQQAYDDIHKKIEESKLAPDNKELEVTFDDYVAYTNKIVDHSYEANQKLREELVRGLTERGELNTEYGQKTLMEFDARAKEEMDLHQKLLDEIDVLLFKKRDNQDEWNEKDEAELAAHLDRLEEITLVKRQETADRELKQLQMQLKAKAKLGYELTEQELEALKTLTMESMETRYQAVANNYWAEYNEIMKVYEAEGELTEEQQKKLDNIYKAMYADMMNVTIEHNKDYMETVTGMTADEIRAYTNRNNELKDIMLEMRGYEAYNQSGRYNDLLEDLRKRKDILERQIKDMDISAEKQEAIAQMLHETIPPEMREMYEDIESLNETTWLNVINEMQKTGNKARLESGMIGKWMTDGLADGLDFEKPIVAMEEGLQRVNKTGMNTVEAKSPSRFYKRLGGYISDGLALGIVGKMKDVTENMKKVMNDASKAATNIAKNFKSIGSNISSGVVSGINAGANSVVSAAKSMASKAFNAAKDFLEIKSPSRRFMGMAEFIPEGMAIGIENESKQAIDAARNLSDDIVKSTDLASNYSLKGTSELRRHTEVTADSMFVQSLQAAIVGAFGEAGPITAYIGKEEAQENFENNLLKSMSGIYNK